MKNARKILAAILVIMTLLLSMSTLVVNAADGQMVYLSPNSNWRADNARFAVYTWDGGNRWFDMEDSNGDGVYECLLPPEVSNIIFVRLAPDSTNSWDSKWNQTEDLVIPTNGDNHYKVASGTWDKGGGSWSYFDSNTCVHAPAGSGTVSKNPTCTEKGVMNHTCSKCGENYTETLDASGHNYGENSICKVCGHEVIYIIAGNVMKDGDTYREGNNDTLFISEWNVSDENNRMDYDEEADCFVKIYKNVAAGEYHFKIAEDMSWDISYGHDGDNCYIKVEEDGSTVSIAFKDGTITVAAARPSTPNTPINPGQNNPSVDNGDSDNSDNAPEEENLNFFQQIFKAIGDFFKSIGDFFKNLFS